MPNTIADALPQMAERQPDAVALWLPTSLKAKAPVRYHSVSYGELAADSHIVAAGLSHLGVTQGVRVAVMVKPGLELFSLTFALFRLGAVPVLIDPGIGLKALKACLGEARPSVFVGIPAAHIARLLFGWGKGSVRQTISVGSRGFWAQTTLDNVREAGRKSAWEPPTVDAEDVAAILFTSGSTGIPKGVVYKHRNFAAQVAMIRDLYDIQPGEIDLPTFPLFALFAPALGTTSVIPPMDFTRPAKVDPLVLDDAIKSLGVTTMFGSPALLNTFSRWTESTAATYPAFKRVISAGAPVPAKVMQRLRKSLPETVQIVTPYGATECLPVTSIESREVLTDTASQSAKGRGVCVGRVAQGAQVRIIQITDSPLEDIGQMHAVESGVIGEICVHSPAVTESYFGRDHATALAKVEDQDGALWHRMGDLGWIDEQERIWFCGRKSQRVQTPAGDRYTVAVESIFNAHPEVHRSALVGVGEPGDQRMLLWVEADKAARQLSDAALRQALFDLAAQHEQAQDIERIEFHAGFPVDIRHNAKIGRERLAVEARRVLT